MLSILGWVMEQQVTKFINPGRHDAISGSRMFGSRKAVVLKRITEMAPLSPVGQRAF